MSKYPSIVEALLTPPQKAWLEAILNKQINGEDVNERVLKVELRNELSRGFDPSEIHSLLLRGKTNITLLGVGLIDPENEIIKTTDAVLQAVHEILTTSPTIPKISAKQVSDATKLNIADVEKIFEKLADVGLFHQSGINGSNGWSIINIDDRAFENYQKYESVAQCLKSKADEIYYSGAVVDTSIEDTTQAISKIDITMQSQADTRKVFVVHGRNWEARKAVFNFLRSIGLHPLEWSEAVKATGKPSPYVGEILDVAFSIAQAVVVLFTPDDEARLLEQFRTPSDESYETELTPQARPNVIFEAGMSMGRSPERTVLVELGKLRPFSDIYGRHVIRLNNSSEMRQEFAQRLATAGCSVNLDGTDWHKEGNFDTKLETRNTQSSSIMTAVEKTPAISQSKSRNLRVKKTFTDREKDQFESEAFEFIAKFFEDSLRELEGQNSHINSNFRRIDANHFTATIYLNDAQANICSIRLNNDRYAGQGISYSHGRASADINDSLSITEDGYNLFLKAMSNLYYSDEKHNLNFEGAAEHFWEKFISPLQQ